MTLRVLALTAPQFVRGHVGSMALSSGDPVSLQNACRYCAYLAENGDPAWSASNWNSSRSVRRESVLLLHDMGHARRVLGEVLPALRPNMVLIGAMSICMSGAIEVAKIAREELGEDVLIVLGGRHASETVFESEGQVIHHPASPLRLMASGRVRPVFDLVVAGDGDMVTAHIGKAVAKAISQGKSARAARFDLDSLSSAPGLWLAGMIDGDIIRVAKGQAGALDYMHMPSPAEMFGVTASFSPFEGLPTAHVFSDIGRGCVYDCAFCSERFSIVGAPRDFVHSADRLYRNLTMAAQTIRRDVPEAEGASAFCEDSTFLGWRKNLIDRFCNLVEQHGLNVRFGGQATIDQILRSPKDVVRLRRTGLEYLFVGVETPVPEHVGGFSKDIGRQRGSWLDRCTDAFELLAAADIKVGVSLLFGLGEHHDRRELMFRYIEKWKRICALETISMNWAVQHPLQNQDGGLGYTYVDWAIDDGEMLDVMRNFGEASTKYTIAGGSPPTLCEARDIVQCVRALLQKPVVQTSMPEVVRC